MTKPEQDTPPKRGFMGRLIRFLGLILAVCILVAAGFGAGFFYFANPMSPSEDMLKLLDKAPEGAAAEGEHASGDPADESVPHKVPRPTPENGGYVTSYYTFTEPLTSNLKDSRRFLQVTVAVATEYDAKVLDQVKANEPALRADALKVISGFSEDELKSTDGRDRLARDLLASINARLKELEGFAGIKEVIFPSYVMQ